MNVASPRFGIGYRAFKRLTTPNQSPAQEFFKKPLFTVYTPERITVTGETFLGAFEKEGDNQAVYQWESMTPTELQGRLHISTGNYEQFVEALGEAQSLRLVQSSGEQAFPRLSLTAVGQALIQNPSGAGN